jgi:uncharacterized protein (DUF1786 family)
MGTAEALTLNGARQMSKFLILDIGAGTMDVLYYDEASEISYRAVVKSPMLHLAEKAQMLHGSLLVTGCEMGGGHISKVLRERAKESEVIMTVSSAATIHHDLEKVKSWGIRLIEDTAADDFRLNKKYNHLVIGDLEVDRLKEIVNGFGVPFEFDVVGICAQDHGVPPEGVSHLDYRHSIFAASLNEKPFPHALLYKNDEIPAVFNRLTSIAKGAKALQVDEVYVMDSGMAAILGASMDIQARAAKKVLILDVATSHTLGAAIEGKEIAGFFEYHTSDITLQRLETLLVGLAEGKLHHKQILREGGHGAFIRKVLGYGDVAIIVATGPKRGLVQKSHLPIVMGAPFGDNMMTGTVGVLEAIYRRKGLKSIQYI